VFEAGSPKETAGSAPDHRDKTSVSERQGQLRPLTVKLQLAITASSPQAPAEQRQGHREAHTPAKKYQERYVKTDVRFGTSM
jgi:hypothetical protein